jgi:hypothetical protein
MRIGQECYKIISACRQTYPGQIKDTIIRYASQ